MNINSFSGQIKSALKEELPGTDVQWEMASSDRKVSNYPREKRDDSKLAAVLIVLYPYKNKVHTLFIQRPVYNGVHSGQIAFPGGKLEEEDTSLISTALREACEETGICSSDIQVLGKLTPLYIPVSNIEVTPVVASMNERPELHPCEDEVVSIIEANLADFSYPEIIKEKAMLVRDITLDIRYFDYKGNVIWGATAMMLYELLILLEKHSISLPQ